MGSCGQRAGMCCDSCGGGTRNRVTDAANWARAHGEGEHPFWSTAHVLDSIHALAMDEKGHQSSRVEASQVLSPIGAGAASGSVGLGGPANLPRRPGRIGPTPEEHAQWKRRMREVPSQPAPTNRPWDYGDSTAQPPVSADPPAPPRDPSPPAVPPPPTPPPPPPPQLESIPCCCRIVDTKVSVEMLTCESYDLAEEGLGIGTAARPLIGWRARVVVEVTFAYVFEFGGNDGECTLSGAEYVYPPPGDWLWWGPGDWEADGTSPITDPAVSPDYLPYTTADGTRPYQGRDETPKWVDFDRLTGSKSTVDASQRTGLSTPSERFSRSQKGAYCPSTWVWTFVDVPQGLATSAYVYQVLKFRDGCPSSRPPHIVMWQASISAMGCHVGGLDSQQVDVFLMRGGLPRWAEGDADWFMPNSRGVPEGEPQSTADLPLAPAELPWPSPGFPWDG